MHSVDMIATDTSILHANYDNDYDYDGGKYWRIKTL